MGDLCKCRRHEIPLLLERSTTRPENPLSLTDTWSLEAETTPAPRLQPGIHLWLEESMLKTILRTVLEVGDVVFLSRGHQILRWWWWWTHPTSPSLASAGIREISRSSGGFGNMDGNNEFLFLLWLFLCDEWSECISNCFEWNSCFNTINTKYVL